MKQTATVDLAGGKTLHLETGHLAKQAHGSTIARLGDNTLTRTGQIVGTISYMSPEQIGAKLVDRRSDLFSCGVMLYELLTYTLPSEGGASLRAAGWRVVGRSRGGSWSRPGRPRRDKAPVGPKLVWSPP